MKKDATRPIIWQFSVAVASGLVSLVAAAADVIPHAQDKLPGPALSPTEAISKMTVPPGFTVELVASEPDIVNPVAMTFDERGRIWITESLEYPRLEAGPGRDRVKVLEDADGDGRADKFTIFADGLNIPSGIAVGYGGVWVANAPDILFLSDVDGDGKCDRREVVVTGFGRDDTHELPNSLTWGPDGWLYGLNGVFNQSQIIQGDRQFNFTCALFRIHPRTREFQLFAEGTSNPWGVAWDNEGSAFVSACVIDHLWHLTETGYYIRQGGPYPPFTSPMGSIVKHKHQKAAYCGIHFFDSDAYPAEYRERLYMGNIHGSAINVDVLSRNGSSYVATPAGDFLTADDAWFMPVVQKTGPDGCLYILDWYDRYHCYQDARRDADGIDRLKGRLYRVRYRETPRAGHFDLAAESDDQLIERLDSPNVLFRDLAQRLLVERSDPNSRDKLARLVLDEQASRKSRMHALWTLVGQGPLPVDFHRAILAHPDAGIRAWGVRAAGNARQIDPVVRDLVAVMANDPSAAVRLQVAIASRKLEGSDALGVLLTVLASCGDDTLLRHIVWQNLHPLLEDQTPRFLELIARDKLSDSATVAALMPRVIERVLACRDPSAVASLLGAVSSDKAADQQVLKKCLSALATKIENLEFPAEQLAGLKPQLTSLIDRVLNGSAADPLYLDAALLATTWRDPRALAAVRTLFAARDQPSAQRARALAALASVADGSLATSIDRLLGEPKAEPVELRAAALDSISRVEADWVARVVLAHYERLEDELRPKAIELLTERGAWAEQLLDSIAAGKIPATALNVNQVRQLLAGGDSTLVGKVRNLWGAVRADRDPRRETVIAEMRGFLRHTSGDAAKGQDVFKRVCGQCHKIYGEGNDVGPDITVNGRSSFEQLLSNVFDPSLVIGPSYQARTVATEDGRVLTGLVAEESAQRVVLKSQGGKLDVIPRQKIEEMTTSRLSLMPEELEKQLKPQELADLFAFLTLDKPPADPGARRLPGAVIVEPRSTTDPAQFAELIGKVAPGFTAAKTGKQGVALIAEHAGREGVLRTTPVSRQEPCVLRRKLVMGQARSMRLVLCVSHEIDGEWALDVRANGRRLHDSVVGAQRDHPPGWRTISLDLSPLVGQEVTLELIAASRGDKNDAAYWERVEIVSEQ